MKRFYKEAAAVAVAGGHEIRLDGRPVRTPARAPLKLPGAALAAAIAGEWQAQGDEVDPRSMPLTGLANAAIDRVAGDRAVFAAGLARYGESDLLYYRSEGPAPLRRRQEKAWDPLLAWARRRYDIDFETATGIVHRPQPARTVEQLARAVVAHDAFELAAMSPLVTISGSVIVALALVEGEADLDTAWAAATVDEAWQTEQWGEDAEAAAALANRRREFEAAARFLDLVRRP